MLTRVRLMISHRTVFLSAPFVAAGLLLPPLPAVAQGMPEGVSVQVVAEYPLDIPGIEKVEVEHVLFEPGATLEFTTEAVEFCNATKGTWTLVNHDQGTTTFFGPGSRWAMPPKGTKVTVANYGGEPAEQWVYKLVETE